jgi:hypothetical protein
MQITWIESCPHYAPLQKMKPYRESPWLQRALYLTAGAAFWIGCGFLQHVWMDIVPYDSFDSQPGWLRGVRWFVGWAPWLAVLGVIGLRIFRGRQVRADAFALGTIAPGFLLFSWLVLGPTIDEWKHLRSFDATAWREQNGQAHEGMWPPRLCMVDDLMSSGELLGKTQGEVIELLGPPAPKGFPAGARASDIHYHLGPERGLFRIDSEWLMLKFGENGQLSRQWLYRD